MKVPVAVGVLLFWASEIHGAAIICQYASYAVYRAPGGQYPPNNLDTSLCTHGVYLTAGLDTNDNFVSLDPWGDLESGGGLGGYKKFTNLTQQNPNFKPLLALGNWAYATSQFAAIAADPTRRERLATNAVSFLNQYGFKGLEIDWFYPASKTDGQNFALLLAEVRKAFDAEGFVLTAGGAALEPTINLYDLEGMLESLDYMLMLAYDYEGPWNRYTGHTAPLYLENNNPRCVNATVRVYLSKTANAKKLALGFPAYGHTYKLADPDQNGVGVDTLGPGESGPYTLSPGTLSFNEIVTATGEWTYEFDSISQATYAYKGNQWLSTDDAKSSKIKASYAAGLGLGGAYLWAIDEDDFQESRYTLLRAIVEGFAEETD